MMNDDRNRLHDILKAINKTKYSINTKDKIRNDFYNALPVADKMTLSQLSLIGIACHFGSFINLATDSDGYALTLSSSQNKKIYFIPIIELATQSLKDIVLNKSKYTASVGTSKEDIHNFIQKKQTNNRKMIYLSITDLQRFNDLRLLRIKDEIAFNKSIAPYPDTAEAISKIPLDKQPATQKQIKKNITTMTRRFYTDRMIYNAVKSF